MIAVVAPAHRKAAFTLTARRRVPYSRPLMLAVAIFTAACGGDSSPTAPSTPTPSGNESWSGVLAPGGASSRSFTVSANGTITVTLTDVGTAVGLGVGVPRVTGGGCRLGVAVTATAGSTPQISTPADAGQYCVQVFDLGSLRDPVGFALKISHP